jgi:hypothetical protein
MEQVKGGHLAFKVVVIELVQAIEIQYSLDVSIFAQAHVIIACRCAASSESASASPSRRDCV